MRMTNNVGLVQAYSSVEALRILREMAEIEHPDTVLLPEYCFDAHTLQILRVHSSNFPGVEFVTAVIMKDKDDSLRNQAIVVENGDVDVVYNKIEPDQNDYEADGAFLNNNRFSNQEREYFVSICRDTVHARVYSPKLWLIPAASVGENQIQPPNDYIGDIFFSNGAPNAIIPSYYMRVADPYQPIVGKLPYNKEIPVGSEGFWIIKI